MYSILCDYENVAEEMIVPVAFSKRRSHIDCVLEQLMALGVPPDCYVLSPLEKDNCSFAQLQEALPDLYARDEFALLSCIPGRVGVYLAEAGTCMAAIKKKQIPHLPWILLKK